VASGTLSSVDDVPTTSDAFLAWLGEYLKERAQILRLFVHVMTNELELAKKITISTSNYLTVFIEPIRQAIKCENYPVKGLKGYTLTTITQT